MACKVHPKIYYGKSEKQPSISQLGGIINSPLAMTKQPQTKNWFAAVLSFFPNEDLRIMRKRVVPVPLLFDTSGQWVTPARLPLHGGACRWLPAR